MTEFKRCKCGYNFIVYLVGSGSALKYVFIDGHSGDYHLVESCPGCQEILDYSTLEG